MTDGSYSAYARTVLDSVSDREGGEPDPLFDVVKDLDFSTVLDVGCGPGQDLLPFLKNTRAVCFGIDNAEDLGKVAVPLYRDIGFSARVHFIRASGEMLPVRDNTFDIVLCSVSLPYMDNRSAIAELGRVLAPGGTLLLKTHALPFYLGMIANRLKTLNPKQFAYPVICLTAGIWHSLTGRQLSKGFWKGKEIYQTRRFLDKELGKNGLRIVEELPDTNPKTPSFRVQKDH